MLAPGGTPNLTATSRFFVAFYLELTLRAVCRETTSTMPKTWLVLQAVATSYPPTSWVSSADSSSSKHLALFVR